MDSDPQEDANPKEPAEVSEEIPNAKTKEAPNMTLKDPVNSIPELVKAQVQTLMRGKIGKGVVDRVSAISRPDLHKTQMQVTWIRDRQCLDIKSPAYDLAPHLVEQLLNYCWNHNMAMRLVPELATVPMVVLTVRWFLPDVLPEMEKVATPPTPTPPEPTPTVVQ